MTGAVAPASCGLAPWPLPGAGRWPGTAQGVRAHGQSGAPDSVQGREERGHSPGGLPCMLALGILVTGAAALEGRWAAGTGDGPLQCSAGSVGVGQLTARACLAGICLFWGLRGTSVLGLGWFWKAVRGAVVQRPNLFVPLARM